MPRRTRCLSSRNILKAHMGSGTLEHDAGITSQAKEGFERTHLPEKIQFYNIARGSTGEVRSLLYVISYNYRRSAPDRRTSERHRSLTWEARLRPLAVDRGTDSQTP